MPTSKYNWEEEKLKYFQSDCEEVKDFLTTFLRLDKKTAENGFWKGKTKGWRTEKEQFKKELAEAEMQKVKNDPDVQEFTKLLIKAKQNAIKKVAMLIGDGKNKITERDIPNIQKGIEICNLELGLATSLAKLELTGKDGAAIKTETIITAVNFIDS